jgi:hypothetical protein
MLNRLDRLRNNRKMLVFLLAHEQIVKVESPETANYDKHTIYLDKFLKPITERWLDILLFARREINVVGGGENNLKKGKAISGSRRVIHTEMGATFDAKNRGGLPPVIEMGDSGQEAWDNFAEAIRAARAAATEANKPEDQKGAE